MNIIAIFAVIIGIFLFILAPINKIFSAIRKKDYLHVEWLRREERLIFLLWIMFRDIYSADIYAFNIKSFSNEMKIPATKLYTLRSKYKIKNLKKTSKTFERYKDSYFDLDRVKKMNTYSLYKRLTDDIDLYDEIKEIYLSYNKINTGKRNNSQKENLYGKS